MPCQSPRVPLLLGPHCHREPCVPGGHSADESSIAFTAKSGTHHLRGQLRCHEPYCRGPHHQGTKASSPRIFADSLNAAKGHTAAGSSSATLYPSPHRKARQGGVRPLREVVVQQQRSALACRRITPPPVLPAWQLPPETLPRLLAQGSRPCPCAAVPRCPQTPLG